MNGRGNTDEHGWTEEAIKAFSDRSLAFHQLQQAEQSLTVARVTYKQAQRAYETAIDEMVVRRRALAAGALADGGGGDGNHA